MAELKTKKNNASVAKFLDSVKDAKRRADCDTVLALMKRATKSEPKMWGSSIVGSAATATSTKAEEKVSGS